MNAARARLNAMEDTLWNARRVVLAQYAAGMISMAVLRQRLAGINAAWHDLEVARNLWNAQYMPTRRPGTRSNNSRR